MRRHMPALPRLLAPTRRIDCPRKAGMGDSLEAITAAPVGPVTTSFDAAGRGRAGALRDARRVGASGRRPGTHRRRSVPAPSAH